MSQDKWTIEDEIFNKENGLVPYKAVEGEFDPINSWLDRHTAMFGPTPSYSERVADQKEAFSEQVDKIMRQKRFTYKFYYLQEVPDRGAEWFPIGQFDVQDQDELWKLEENLRKKYKADIKYNKTSSRW